MLINPKTLILNPERIEKFSTIFHLFSDLAILAMASRCNRFLNKASISNLKSAFRSTSMSKSASSSPKFPLPTRSTTTPIPRFSVSRCPSELGCVQSLLPLHNAVAAARLTSCLSTTSRSCRSLSQGTLSRTSPGL